MSHSILNKLHTAFAVPAFVLGYCLALLSDEIAGALNAPYMFVEMLQQLLCMTQGMHKILALHNVVQFKGT